MDLHGFKAGELSYWASPVEGNGNVVSYREDAIVQPASVMKVVTSWAALNVLKPDFRWKTVLVSNAPVVQGVLQGDLYWVGSGDPYLLDQDLQDMQRMLRRRGIERIAGRLILDKSAFTRIAPADDFGGDDGKVFTVDPDTHLLHLKVVWLNFFNDDAGPRVVLEPQLVGVKLDAKLTDGGDVGSCKEVRDYVQVQAADDRITVKGKLPKGCDGSRMFVNVLDHDAYAGQSFSALWKELNGVGITGVALGKAPSGARVLAEHVSAPLSTVLHDINKYSNNTMARTLYLTMGSVRAGTTGVDTVTTAEQVVREALQAHHIDDKALVLENGSGLSRKERVSTRLLGEVLLDAARGPYFAELAASFPIAGEDGTLKKHFISLGNRLRFKTGTIKNVKALAGYWTGADGRRYVLVVIVNASRPMNVWPGLESVVGDLLNTLDQKH